MENVEKKRKNINDDDDDLRLGYNIMTQTHILHRHWRKTTIKEFFYFIF